MNNFRDIMKNLATNLPQNHTHIASEMMAAAFCLFCSFSLLIGMCPSFFIFCEKEEIDHEFGHLIEYQVMALKEVGIKNIL